MPLPHQALVFVTDGRKMLFLRNQGDENQIDLRTEAHDERHDRKDREIKTDAPGTSKQSFGFGAPALGETDFHEQEKTLWARVAAERINKRATTIMTRWRSSPHPARSPNCASISTRKPSAASL
jgi:protein required for attachment to host cells